MAVKDWAERLDTKGKIVCSTVVALSLLSAILGFSAEGERVRPDEVRRVNGSCTYPKSASLGLGISAALFILAAQVLVNVFGGCICCERRSGSKVSLVRIATIGLICSWIAFFFAFVLLLVGASLNQRHQDDHWFSGQCYVVRRGVFAGAAALSLVTGALGVIYYFVAYEVRKHDWQSRQPGVTMGQSYGAAPFACINSILLVDLMVPWLDTQTDTLYLGQSKISLLRRNTKTAPTLLHPYLQDTFKGFTAAIFGPRTGQLHEGGNLQTQIYHRMKPNRIIHLAWNVKAVWRNCSNSCCSCI